MKNLKILFYILLVLGFNNLVFADAGKDLFNQAKTAYRKGDFAKSAELYEKSCNAGNAWACSNTGYLYSNGKGVEKNPKKAFDFYNKGCNEIEKIHAPSCSNLAIIYHNGEGVEKDTKQAIKYYTKACKADFAEGCFFLAQTYAFAEGVERDLEKAYMIYKLSCDKKYARGCYVLATLTKMVEDERKDKNFVCSNSYYGKACNLGMKEACQKYDKNLTDKCED